jgi:hypothetical protein
VRERSGARIAAGYFLGFALVALVVFAWLRGAGRFLAPLLLVGLAAYGVLWFVRKVREPLP